MCLGVGWLLFPVDFMDGFFGKLLVLHTIGICLHNIGSPLPRVLHLVSPPIYFNYSKIKQKMPMD